MADPVHVVNWPTDEGGDAGAIIKLWEYLRTLNDGPKTIDEHLALVRRCRAAIIGNKDPAGGVSADMLAQARSRAGMLP